MIRNKVNRIIAIALSMSLIGQVILPNEVTKASEKTITNKSESQKKISTVEKKENQEKTAPYVQDFNNGDISGWEKVWGGGSIEAAEGGLRVQGANAFNSADGKAFTLVKDNNSPVVKDGQLEVDMKVRSHAGRMAIVLRYVDEKNYECIGYDVGNTWVYIRATNGNETNTPITTTGTALGQNTDHKLRLEFSGKNLKLLVDGSQIYQGDILTEDRAGKIGFRGWGYDGNYSNAIYDNLVLSQYKEVSVSPSSQYIKYEDAGKKDITVNLSTAENPLSSIVAKGETLVKDVDYTVDGTSLVFKKEYIEKIKDSGETTLELTFKDGFKAKFVIQVQMPPEEYVEYNRDFSQGIEGMKVVRGSANIASEDNKLKVPTTSDAIVIDENSPVLYNTEVEFVVDPANDNGNFGAVVRYADNNSWTYIGQDGQSGTWGSSWFVLNSEGQRRNIYNDSARLFGRRTEPYTIKIKVVEKVVSIYLDGGEIFNGVVDEVTGDKGKSGIRFHGNNGGNIESFNVITGRAVEASSNIEFNEVEINSDALKVKMDDKFPRVISYQLKENEEMMYGQESQNYVVEINNKAYTPVVTSEFNGDTIAYHMSIEELGMTFDVVYKVEGNVLNMNVTNINDEQNKLYTINFPENSLVSVRSNQPGAKLKGENHILHQGVNRIDEDLTNKGADKTYATTTIAILNTDTLAASMTSSSIKLNQEIAYQTFENEAGYKSTGLWTNEYMYRGILDNEVIEEPWAKVTITGDRNKDNKVDYIDGAIAHRDDIKPEQVGIDIVQNAYSSVAMNVGSVAQYPFLRILDNVKKFNLGTDGFEQNIIIKGYQTEGHDASHPDYANISTRAGGEEDFKTLVEEAQNYGAYVGVHINHTEAYPEAKQYSENLVSDVGAWSWYDSAKQIIRENDILDTEEGMEKRLDDLAAIVPGLDMVYVDVYSDTRWPAHKLSSKLNDLGWAIASEYPEAFNPKSVWAHHVTGSFNDAGNLTRFINHQTQESFSSHRLFRGVATRVNGINGWQGASNYNDTIRDFYTNILPNKYLMHFPMSQWESNDRAVLGENNEVVTTYENGKNVIRKDNKIIANGNKLFIPWNPETEDKIYHWTDENGKTTWELPNSWAGLESVVLYKLTDEGKTEKTLVQVVDGSVTLNTKANTAYIVYKEEAPETQDMEWSKGSFVKDMGFDSHRWDYGWKKSSTAENTDHINFVNNAKGNTHVKVEGNKGADATITQTITGLEGGKTYSASVWMEVSEGRKSEIVVTTPDGKEVSNYTDRSNVKYGSTHNDKLNSYYQRVKVTFTQPEGETTAEIKFNVHEGSANSWANIDDVRVVEVGVSDNRGHDYFEDFENVDQGYGPFESTSSDNSHLSETNSPYTNDTIEGRYSMKVRSGDYMRTLPHRIRFKPNTTYKVGLDYLTWADNAFTLGVKSDKAREAGDTANAVIASKNVSRTGQIEVEFTTGNYDDYYIDITKNAATEYIFDNLYVDEVNKVNKSELQKVYDENKERKDNFYLEEAWTEFNTALDNAKTVLANILATQEEVDSAKTSLQAAVSKLKSCDLNGNGKLEVGDVSIVSKYYGKTSDNSGADWSKISAYDVNNDNKIDNNDISIIVDKVIK
ncbi:endo-alpha-N-acetylgalactosaminidase family protein [Clostridium sp.]|uniref:endo-alpha-N-acetylgalactosaminidase family protein n=1 Tax=Clostridium sp. TaxID=1506 RepID=UPI003F2E5E7A